jgi:3-dehydroquinate synthase
MSEISSTSCSIYVSENISKDIIRFLKANKKGYSKLFVLVDENSLKHCYPWLVASVPQLAEAEIIEIESGEENKTIEICTQIWSLLSEYGADRNSLFINLGGGVICDLGGFAASCFKRGIPFINIPTTLLSQVDASVGGKTGINSDHLKNEVGLFSSPAAVFVSTRFLSTINARHLLSGFAEIIKHALISDSKQWEKITECSFDDLDELNTCIMASIVLKNEVVMQDPTEKGLRKILNFGHSIGHALETFFMEQNGAHHLLHGEAVAIGIVCESYLSHKVCKLKKEELETITKFVLKTYQPVIMDSIYFNRLVELMKHDKKNNSGAINFSLLSSIGKCEINKSASADLIIESLKYYSEQVKLAAK